MNDLTLRCLLVPVFLGAIACSSPEGTPFDPGAPSEPGSKAGGGAMPAPTAAPTTAPDDPGPPPFVPARRFAPTPSSWVIPAGALSSSFMNYRGTFWDLLDMNGDGRPDLVVSTSSGAWQVYENLGGKLAQTATSWAVPSERFRYVHDLCAGLIDVDGDGKIDLVDLCEVNGAAAKAWGADSGAPHWKVYTNTGSGFASTASLWSLPFELVSAAGGIWTVEKLPGTQQPYVSMGSWAALDVDGDSKLDLLAMQPKSAWKIYRASANGFAASPATFSVPSPGSDPFGDYTFGSLNGGLWAVMDLDGDRMLDFVVTGKRIGSARRPFETLKKTPYWKVHRGGAAGFASSPINWAVPGGVEYPVDTDNYGTKSSTFDIDGDGKPDLVTFGAREVFGATSSSPYWRVYFGSNARFGDPMPGAPAPSADPGPEIATTLMHEWRVPPKAARIGQANLVSREADGWLTFDIDGDRRLDLVVFIDPTHWDVYPGAP